MKIDIILGNIKEIKADAYTDIIFNTESLNTKDDFCGDEMFDCGFIGRSEKNSESIKFNEQAGIYCIQLDSPLYNKNNAEFSCINLGETYSCIFDKIFKYPKIKTLALSPIGAEEGNFNCNTAANIAIDSIFKWESKTNRKLEDRLSEIKIVVTNKKQFDIFNRQLKFRQNPMHIYGSTINLTGAIVGDYVGSRFEFNNIKEKAFKFIHPENDFTDDTVMTIAIFEALMNSNKSYSNLEDLTVKSMQKFGRKYIDKGFGSYFLNWIQSDNPKPYNSWGNGSAMRVSGCGFIANSLEEAEELAEKVSKVTHNHPEGIKGAKAVAAAIFMARTGKTIEEIKKYITDRYYKIDFTIDSIRGSYVFDVSCQGSVPQALEAFFESINFEDAIRNAVSIGGDSDTLAAITGGIAGAYYGVPGELINSIVLDPDLVNIITDFSLSLSKKNKNKNKCPYCHQEDLDELVVPLEKLNFSKKVINECIKSGSAKIKNQDLCLNNKKICRNCGWIIDLK